MLNMLLFYAFYSFQEKNTGLKALITFFFMYDVLSFIQKLRTLKISSLTLVIYSLLNFINCIKFSNPIKPCITQVNILKYFSLTIKRDWG